MTDIHNILKQYWGYERFRPLQEDIINSILAKQDTLALLPTGGGKSVCYQVPALAMEGVCLVISPLIALMQDQVARLKELGIRAECINSGMHFSDVQRVLQNTLHGGYKLLYISPERLQTRLFSEYLPHMDISMIAVDEAHCISQWGHDFRPDYLKIAELKEVFRDIPVLALTASATQQVQDDIAQQLKLKNIQVYRQSFERKNIFYDITYTENKNGTILSVLDDNTCSIIYCRSRRNTIELSKYLQQHGIRAIAYHAGMTKPDREQAQQSWMENRSKVMVATTAFGMGIDKADVRTVIHYDVPEHLEAYYQESGRAGRDGKPSQAILLYNNTDIKRLKDSVDIKYPPTEYLRKVYQSVAEYLQLPIGVEPNKYYDFDLEEFCKRFKLQALPASSALKLLEQEGLWTMTEAVYNPITVHVIANRSELDELPHINQDLSYIMTHMLRLYNGLFTQPTVIRIGAIAKQVKMPMDMVERALIQLQRLEYIEYNKPRTGPQMFFHHNRADSKYLIINTQRIQHLKQLHQQRTDAIIAFVTDDGACRNRMLLSYFDEPVQQDCMHCDYCRTHYRNKKRTDTKQLRHELLTFLKHKTKTPVNTIQAALPHAIKEDVIALIRQLADEQAIVIHTDNSISLA